MKEEVLSDGSLQIGENLAAAIKMACSQAQSAGFDAQRHPFTISRAWHCWQ